MAHLAKLQISQFFSPTLSITQDQCDQEAMRLTGQPCHPVPVLGGESYTVLTDDDTLVVQFRAADAALDLERIKCVENTYGSFVPRHKSVGKLGPLHVYTMGNIGGVAMYLARETLNQDNYRLLHQTVQDFAMSVALKPSQNDEETEWLTGVAAFSHLHGGILRVKCRCPATSFSNRITRISSYGFLENCQSVFAVI